MAVLSWIWRFEAEHSPLYKRNIESDLPCNSRNTRAWAWGYSMCCIPFRIKLHVFKRKKWQNSAGWAWDFKKKNKLLRHLPLRTLGCQPLAKGKDWGRRGKPCLIAGRQGWQPQWVEHVGALIIPSPIVLNFPNTKETGSGSPNAGIWILLNWGSQLGPFKINSANLAFEDKVNKCHLAVLRVLKFPSLSFYLSHWSFFWSF